MILDKIVKEKFKQLEREKSETDLNKLLKKLESSHLHKIISLSSKIKGKDQVSLIAEIKKASPSKGIIKEDFEHLHIANEYNEANVEAVSILTEKNFFLGSDKYLTDIREKYQFSILRKDFIIDEWQIYQSRLIGADAILLIVSILSDDKIYRFKKLAYELGLECLVEIHNEEELKRIYDMDINIIGINNRDLKTFEVSLLNTERLIKLIPDEKIIVSESGIKDKSDISFLKKLKVDAVLMGETFMKSNSIKRTINNIRSEC
ncbi:MAG: indole-3-glycerol phosphate synthase TrpC [Clostridiales bacterium]